jgi:hypothetical protein
MSPIPPAVVFLKLRMEVSHLRRHLSFLSRLSPDWNAHAGLADDPDRAVQLKTAEIKHSRLAMVAFFGFAVQAGFTDSTSPLDNLNFLN